MPRLLGLVSAPPVDLSISLADAAGHFAALGQNNPDGWGLAWLENDEFRVNKHDLPIRGDIPAGQASAAGESPLFVAHVRRASRAPRAVKNTHPFVQGGWAFAHSGALYPLLEVSLRRAAGRALPYEGQTDSEAFFHLILANLEKLTDPVEAIRASAQLVIGDGQFSGLNFLLASRDALYAFRYSTRSASYYSLYFLRRQPGCALQSVSSDTRARVRSVGLAGVEAVVVCSEQIDPPAPHQSWQPLEMGELLVVRREPGLPAEIIRLF